MYNIILGVTGSVAAIKTSELVASLQQIGNVIVVTTKAGEYFLKNSPTPAAKIYRDENEWPDTYKLGDPIVHIELRNWANLMVVAPLDANTLSKFANGACDNLLTSVFRAWNWRKPMFAALAMNTFMWENPPTAKQLEEIQKYGVRVIHPIEKRLACNDVGMGAMESVSKIVETITRTLTWDFPLGNCNGIPVNHHPGAFGFHRRKNHHTGVDLYCKDGSPVYAVEDGEVVHVDYFTGPKLGHDWWEETWGVMVEGASGVVNYGEVTPHHFFWPWASGGGSCLMKKVSKGQLIGKVKRVLFEDKLRPDIPGHSTSMLHLELYKHGSRDFADWHDVSKNPNLLDPTPYLLAAKNRPVNTLLWDNAEGKPVG